MLMRFLAGALLLVLLVACHRLSADERKVIGTWKQNSFDGTEYYILRPDHSYAFIAEVPDEDYKNYRRALACSGSWLFLLRSGEHLGAVAELVSR